MEQHAIEMLESVKTLRHAVATATASSYGAMREYALKLNEAFEGFDWFDVAYRDVGDLANAVHAEKKALFDELKAINHSNPSTIWARVRKYAEESKYPPVVVEGEGEGEGQGEGEGGDTKTVRPPVMRNLEELAALWKFNARQESLSENLVKTQALIKQALDILGYHFD